MAHKFRNARLRFGDPLVKFEWCGEKILLPLSHDLPRFVNTFPRYNVTLGQLVAAMTRCLTRPIVAIDVGANVGDTAILMARNGARSVICVEGSPRYAALLRQNTAHLPQIISTQCLVAFAGAAGSVRIFESRGTGFVVESSDAATVPVMTLGEILAHHHVDMSEIDLVKIDTDGYDGAIIRHHAVFLTEVKPVIHFEYLFSADGGMSIAPNLPDERAFETLAAAGYERFIAYQNTGNPVIYSELAGAPKLLRELYASGQLGVYADIAAFPKSASFIAEEIAFEVGLGYTN